MAAPKDSFANLELHRQRLEQNVDKLRNALDHWRLWDAEYEALKEEVQSLPATAGSEGLARIRRDFDGDLVDDKEIGDIFGQKNAKRPEQIVNLLSRRVDYVSENINTLEKQLEAAEAKVATASIISDPDVRDEEGLPMTDIVEELDEDDNVVSSYLQRPGAAQPQLLEALKKAGVKEEDLPVTQKPTASDDQVEPDDDTNVSSPAPVAENIVPQSKAGVLKSTPLVPALEEEPATTSSPPEPQKAVPEKRSVSFAEDTKPAHDPTEPSRSRLEEIMRMAKAQETTAHESPVIPEDESPEDASLRREMLEYSRSELGAVVAELEIDDGQDYSETDEFDLTDEDEDDEDNYGRSNFIVNQDYRKKMHELEKKLGVKPMAPVSEAEETSDDDNDEGIGRISVVKETNDPVPNGILSTRSADGPLDDGKKIVRFAESLDIAPPASTDSPSSIETNQARVEPLGDVVERKAEKTNPQPQSSTRPSRFKQSRVAASQGLLSQGPLPSGPRDAPAEFIDQEIRIAPSGPEGRIAAPSVIEREVSSEAREPDELDASLLHQEVALEHNRLRNKFIQKEGGFMKENESPVVPVDEEDGGPKRMSRFKAARLSRQ